MLALNIDRTRPTISGDTTYHEKNTKEVIAQWTLLPDGNLVGVGYLEKDKTKEGLLIKIDSETGSLVFKKKIYRISK